MLYHLQPFIIRRKNKPDGVRPPSASYLGFRPEPVGGALTVFHPPICGLPLVLPSDLPAPLSSFSFFERQDKTDYERRNETNDEVSSKCLQSFHFAHLQPPIIRRAL
jgi:hypothetical protein